MGMMHTVETGRYLPAISPERNGNAGIFVDLLFFIHFILTLSYIYELTTLTESYNISIPTMTFHFYHFLTKTANSFLIHTSQCDFGSFP